MSQYTLRRIKFNELPNTSLEDLRELVQEGRDYYVALPHSGDNYQNYATMGAVLAEYFVRLDEIVQAKFDEFEESLRKAEQAWAAKLAHLDNEIDTRDRRIKALAAPWYRAEVAWRGIQFLTEKISEATGIPFEDLWITIGSQARASFEADTEHGLKSTDIPRLLDALERVAELVQEQADADAEAEERTEHVDE
jgi:hypothetical protein